MAKRSVYKVWQGGKESAYNIGEAGSIPGLGRSLGVGKSNPLHSPCLGNPMDRGAWWAIQSMGLQRVGHGWETEHRCMHV